MNSQLTDLTLRQPEYQVVIIIDYDDGNLYPLTEKYPKCLLPIANRPMIDYVLDTLERSDARGMNLISTSVN
jgi:dTDP-glucose pyrophosphorylase